MIEISFAEKDDAKRVYDSLCHKAHIHSINYINVILADKIVSIHLPKNSKFVVNFVIIPVLKKHIITTIEDQWLLSLIENKFYFTSFEEQEQILQIVHSLMEGNVDGIPDVIHFASRQEVISLALSRVLHETASFSFESFLKFRLKAYTDLLLKYVAVAIDEYKLEQEYQTFVQQLREFVINRTPKMNVMHIVHEEQFCFFTEELREIKREEIRKFIDRKLIQNHPLYIDSAILAPLISIAPKNIHLYTNQLDDGMVQTVQKIFLERVQIYSKKYFDQVIKKTKI